LSGDKSESIIIVLLFVFGAICFFGGLAWYGFTNGIFGNESVSSTARQVATSGGILFMALGVILWAGAIVWLILGHGGGGGSSDDNQV
jgi:hypothetical protein